MDDGLAIEVSGLAKRYGDVDAVAGVDLQIPHGECFALLGPNGAGKTTTTEILEGYRSRDAGQVQVLGVDPRYGDGRWRSRLGIVLQTARDLGDLTVHEVVRHFAGYYPHPRDVEDVIDMVGLADKRRSRVDALSGGQRRRLDVALGVVGDPEVLFLDEPTTGFDPEARRHFWGILEGLSEGGTTILLTTHYLDEAERLADRVGVISRGRVLACDTPQHLGDRQRRAARVQWVEDGTPRAAETEQPTALVADLSRRLGGEVPGLAVVRPSLEDVYLALVGDDVATDPEPSGEQP